MSFELIIPRSDYFFSAPIHSAAKEIEKLEHFAVHKNDTTEAYEREEMLSQKKNTMKVNMNTHKKRKPFFLSRNAHTPNFLIKIYYGK